MKKKKPAQWEPPPLDPRQFDDPCRVKKTLREKKRPIPPATVPIPGVRKGQIMRRVGDGILYLAS